MRYAAVFPVPFLALAIIGFLCLINGIDYSCTGVGCVNPFDANARSIFYYRPNYVNE